MKNQMIQKSILRILSRLPDVYLREATLAAEVEIAIDRQMNVNEFADEIHALLDLELIERDSTLLGDNMYHITGKGKLAEKEGCR